MTDNNKTNAYSGTFTGFTGGIGSNGQVTGSQIVNNLPERKTCRGCLKEIGESQQGNCRCHQKDGYCEWCEEGKGVRKNCLCQKKELSQKSETSSTSEFAVSKEFQTQSFLSSQNQTILTKLNHLLKAKNSFLQARQLTIQELKICCNELEKFLNEKHATISEVGNAFSNVGGSIANVITFGIPKAIGESIKSGNNFSKIKFSGKSSKEFQIFLNDENELVQLSEAYNALWSIVYENKNLEIIPKLENTLNLKRRWSNNEPKLFNLDYKIFDILTDEGVWEGRPLDPEKMAIAIKVLNKNLKELRKELDEQLEELRNEFGTENIKTDLNWEIQEIETQIKSLQFQPSQEKDLQQQIMIKKLALEKLVSSAKEKLKSQSKFSESKCKERNEKLETLFKNLPTDQDEIVKSLENVKKNLSRKLNWNEIDSLCRTNQELKQLKFSLQNQRQYQIQIPPK